MENLEILKNIKDYMQWCIDRGYYKFTYIDAINLIDDVLTQLTKQEKMIELMTNFIYHIGYYEDSYGNSCAIIQDSCFKNKTKESCEECIKQYFEKKAGVNKWKK